MTTDAHPSDDPVRSIASTGSTLPDELRPPPPPPGYRNGEGGGKRTGSPARDMTTFHPQRTDKERLDVLAAYLSRRGRRVPSWAAFGMLLDTSPLLAAALEADRVEREWEARKRDRSG